VAFVKQSASVIGGPNQLATYLLPAFFISISRMVGHSKDLSKKTSFLYLVLSILFNLVIFLTFSRSAILALLILLVVAAVSMLRNKWLKNYVITLVVALTLILVVVFSLKENSIEIITHGRSQSEHATAMSVSLLEISSRLHHPVSLLFGAGLGTAGPLALKYGEGIISESWYLQLALELGIAGLILWLAFIASILKELFKKYEFGLFFALISVSIAAMFLHTFADNLALTYTLFILIGLLLNNKTYEKNFN
jgi:O-antigen ligase